MSDAASCCCGSLIMIMTVYIIAQLFIIKPASYVADIAGSYATHARVETAMSDLHAAVLKGQTGMVMAVGPVSVQPGFPATDADFGVAPPGAMHLQRSCHMYQWHEEKTSRFVTDTLEEITYHYTTKWSSDLVYSSGFERPQGHQNPGQWGAHPQSASFNSPRVSITPKSGVARGENSRLLSGAIHLPNDAVNAMVTEGARLPSETLDLKSASQSGAAIAAAIGPTSQEDRNFKIVSSPPGRAVFSSYSSSYYLSTGYDPRYPNVGDVQCSWTAYYPPREGLSIVGFVSGEAGSRSLGPVKGSNNQEVLPQAIGEYTDIGALTKVGLIHNKDVVNAETAASSAVSGLLFLCLLCCCLCIAGGKK